MANQKLRPFWGVSIKLKWPPRVDVSQHIVTRFKCLKGVSGSARASREAICRVTILGG
jgi:hypothetical protein